MHRQHHGVQHKRYHLAQQVPYVREMSAQLVKTRRVLNKALATLKAAKDAAEGTVQRAVQHVSEVNMTVAAQDQVEHQSRAQLRT